MLHECYISVTWVLHKCHIHSGTLFSWFCLQNRFRNGSKKGAKSGSGETMKTVLPSRRELTLALQAGCKNENHYETSCFIYSLCSQPQCKHSFGGRCTTFLHFLVAFQIDWNPCQAPLKTSHSSLEWLARYVVESFALQTWSVRSGHPTEISNRMLVVTAHATKKQPTNRWHSMAWVQN